MYPREFEYKAAGSVDEAAQLLDANPGAKVMSGGMSLIPMMKLRLLSPELVVDIGRVPGLDTIEDRGDHIAIGALVRQRQIAESPLIPTALKTAAAQTGDAQVRNTATFAGAIAHADVAADTPTAFVALGGTIVARCVDGEREIAADACFVDTLTSALAANEILTEVRIPKSGGGSAYDKLGRRGGHTDYSVAGAAAWVADSSGRDCRVAVGGVGTVPSLASGVMESMAEGAGPEAAAERACEGITVLEDLYGSEEYKTHLAKVFVRRALEQAMANAG
jgi:carbon-monoxide dehydrogenase medium subunit